MASATRVLRARLPGGPPLSTVGAFWALLLVGVGLRLCAILTYSPAVVSPAVHDAASYIDAAHYALGGASLEPEGYPLFLRVLHAVSHSLTFAIVVQHAIGLATGVLLFLAVRRLGGSAWLGLIPAVAIWLNGDQLFLEHAPLSETLFTFVLTAMIFAGIRALEGGVRWAALAGALGGALLVIRSAAVLLPVVEVAWLTLALVRLRVPWRRPAATTLVAALLVTGAYAVVRHHDTGRWSAVLVDGSGWNLYARTASFADCHRFHPPAGTARLCLSTPANRRLGPSYYLNLGGPAIAAFGGVPSHDALLARFARAAIAGQPLDYLRVVGTDLARYVNPSVGPAWPNDFAGVEPLNFVPRGPAVDPSIRREVNRYYGTLRPPSATAAAHLLDYQRVARITGPILLGLVLLGAAAVPLGRGPRRWAAVLLMAVAGEVVVTPVLVLHAEWRYVMPALGPLAAAAALGGWGLARCAHARLPGRTRPAEAPTADPVAAGR